MQRWGLEDWNKFRFSTKYIEDEIFDASEGSEFDLYYYGYRYYSPRLGRWITRDPIGEKGGLNLLSFLNNNVPQHVDYLGMGSWELSRPGEGAFLEKQPGKIEHYLGSTTSWINGYVLTWYPNAFDFAACPSRSFLLTVATKKNTFFGTDGTLMFQRRQMNLENTVCNIGIVHGRFVGQGMNSLFMLFVERLAWRIGSLMHSISQLRMG